MRRQYEDAALSEIITRTEQELDQLKKCNAFDDAFHIYYEGHFATINGFRLGRLPSQPVSCAMLYRLAFNNS
jgi:beclin